MDEFTMALMTPLTMTTWIVVERFDGLVDTHLYNYTRFHDIDELEFPSPPRIFYNGQSSSISESYLLHRQEL